MNLSMPPSFYPVQQHFGGPPFMPAASVEQLDSSSSTAAGIQQQQQKQSKVNIQLANRELWTKFHRAQNEMVVTRTGRKMFPKLELILRGLEPEAQYSLELIMRRVDKTRYKYQAGGWSAAGQDDHADNDFSNKVQHHDGWNSGDFWVAQERVSFDRVKLTNSDKRNNSLISLCSMHKYQPVVLLFQAVGQGQFSLIQQFEPLETQFMAVTAYQSEAVTRLKVEHNPFAKGFREGSSRKRTLSPLTAGGVPAGAISAALGTSPPSAVDFPLLPPTKRQFLTPTSSATATAVPFAFPALYGSFPSAYWAQQPTPSAPAANFLAAATAMVSMANAGSFGSPLVAGGGGIQQQQQPSPQPAFDWKALMMYQQLYQQMMAAATASGGQPQQAEEGKKPQLTEMRQA